MTTETRYVRLGLFVLIGIVVMLATGLFFMQRIRSRDVIRMVTYVTENVSGLDISSQVRYRGVPIGRVTDLRVDPVGSAIEIDFEIFQDRVMTIGASLERVKQAASLEVVPRLRSRVIANPVSGEAYLLLDAPVDAPPPPDLGFTPKAHYVPSMPSPLAAAQDRLPQLLDRATTTLQNLGEIVARIPGSLDRSDRFFTNVERILRESDLPALSAELRSFSTTSSVRMAEMAADIDRVMGNSGTFLRFTEEASDILRQADMPASSKAAREAADRASLAADDLRRSLPMMRDTLEQLRELARLIETQPESVVYGPRPSKSGKGR
jgi:paraquat-inducible protein B